MAKVLKMQAMVNDNFDKVIVRVTEQTHVGTAFGENGSKTFTASNKITLGSNQFVAKDADDKNKFWVKGTGPTKKQNNSFVVSKKKYEQIKEAVAEYNYFFSDEQIANRSGFGPCPFGYCCETVG